MTFIRTSNLLAALALAVAVISPRLPAQTVSDIVVFDDANYLGYPAFAPVQGHNGLLYGAIASPNGASGAIIDFTIAGGAYDTILTLTPSLGSVPSGGVTLATDGNFYGVTLDGGSYNYGVLYRVTPGGIYTVLHDFTGGLDSGGPDVTPIQAIDGDIYGTTLGACCASTVFKYSLTGGFSTIYSFDEAHGYRPNFHYASLQRKPLRHLFPGRHQ